MSLLFLFLGALMTLANGCLFARLWRASEGDALGIFFGALTALMFTLTVVMLALAAVMLEVKA